MTCAIRKAEHPDEFHTIAGLAKVIWEAHFTPLIGAPQVAYMLERFQSAVAISAQVQKDGYEYYILWLDSQAMGYFALRDDQLSKIYTHPDVRGRGMGHALLEHARQVLRSRNKTRIWLTVNKGNQTALDFYRRHGFAVADAMRIDIGNGFVMDDFRMEADLAAAGS